MACAGNRRLSHRLCNMWAYLTHGVWRNDPQMTGLSGVDEASFAIVSKDFFLAILTHKLGFPLGPLGWSLGSLMSHPVFYM